MSEVVVELKFPHRAKTADVQDLLCIIKEEGYVFTKEEDVDSGILVEYRIYAQENKLFTCQRISWPGEDDEQNEVFSDLEPSGVYNCLCMISGEKVKWGVTNLVVKGQLEQFIRGVKEQINSGTSFKDAMKFKDAVKFQATLLCRSRACRELTDTLKAKAAILNRLEGKISTLKEEMRVARQELARLTFLPDPDPAEELKA